MTFEEFLAMVKLMRHKQKGVLKYRHQKTLKEAEEMEALVDRTLKHLGQPRGLFEGENDVQSA